MADHITAVRDYDKQNVTHANACGDIYIVLAFIIVIILGVNRTLPNAQISVLVQDETLNIVGSHLS